MPFVKLDCGILNSTLWLDRECREIFITGLLMAEPIEFHEEMPQIEVRSLTLTGWSVPPGWYGFIPAAGSGIGHRAGVTRDVTMVALEKLGNPESDSRTVDFGGRRMVRVSGGYVILNFMKYRDRDYTCAQRAKRYRLKKAAERERKQASHRDNVTSRRNVTQAEAEAEAEAYNNKSTDVLKGGVEGKEQKPAARAKAPTLPDDLFLSELKRHYPDIDIDRELGKMRAFFLTPRAKGRQMTRRFVVGWLNRCDVPMKGESIMENNHKKNGAGAWLDSNGQKSPTLSQPTEVEFGQEAMEAMKLLRESNGLARKCE